MKRILTLVACLSLVASLAVGGSIAYLQDTDQTVNVMTLGNVKIELLEQERVDDKENQHTLQAFANGKPLYPAVYEGDTIPYAEENEWVEAGNSDWKVVADNANVVDKFVSVKNTGKSDAYVRVWYAFECVKDPATDGDYVHLVLNKKDDELSELTMLDGVHQIGESTYQIGYMTYLKPIAAGTTTIPSLKQVYLDKAADNDYVEQFGDTYEIIVVAQAIQTQGFETVGAAAALAEAFHEGAANDEELAALAIDWFEAALNESSGDTWDGTADTSWYNDTATEFVIYTAEQLAGLAELVDGGNTFEGKTVKLGSDLDLAFVNNGEKVGFNPIGHSSNKKSFNGTFDGQGHTISNMYMQSNLDSNNGGWLYEGEYYALFAYTNGATIKNLTVSDAYISSGRNEAASIAGNAVNTSFENISIEGVTLIGYNNSCGGVAAECYGNCSFTDITVDEDTVIGPLWGTYDVRLGGVVGMVQAGNNVTFKDVNVSCKLDAINDVAANYQYWLYRYCGMLIGTVDGVNGVADPTGYVTCENVTVTYGDWVDYHYCEFASLGAGSYNGPGEYKYARVEAGTGTGGIDLNTCNHSEDESHNVLITFDQLFGGGQGVSGLKTYNGVTVNYNK